MCPLQLVSADVLLGGVLSTLPVPVTRIGSFMVGLGLGRKFALLLCLLFWQTDLMAKSIKVNQKREADLRQGVIRSALSVFLWN